MVIRLGDTTVKEKDLDQIVIGDPFSWIRLEGKLNIMVDGHNQLEIPYSASIPVKDILDAHIKAGNYDIATELIYKSFEKFKKEMKSWKQKPNQEDISALHSYEACKDRFVNVAKQGSHAFIKMYLITKDEKYIDKSLKLLNRISRTKETASEQLGYFIYNHIYIMHEKIKKAAVKAFVKEKNYGRAMMLAKGDSKLVNYVNKHKK